MSAHRLASGGLIDRAQPLSFSFDGQTYSGFAGDTLASALMANGVTLVGRSFKYHRPRGILTAGSDEPNALVELRTGARREPNTRATTAELYEGLIAASQNRWPSLAFDLGAVNDLFSRFLVAGFYYKTFMWPAKFWEAVYEPLIRRAAGLGRAADAEDPDHYEKATAHCDVLVIGGGPTGLMAALAAGRAGARVILCDEDFRLGGRLLSERSEINAKPAVEWVAEVEAELAAMPEVRIMRRTTVTSVYDHGQYGALERVNDHVAVPPEHEPRQRAWKIVAKRAVLAAGALERMIAFGNNDRPGVMLASAARSYINRYAAAPGKRLAIFTNNDDGWRTAADARAAGIEIAAVVDSRSEPPGQFAALGIKALTGAQVSHVHGRRGVEAIDVVDGAGRVTKIACDALAVSGGWNPAVHLTCHLNGKPVWNEALAAFVPGAVPDGMHVAGAANGTMKLADCLSEGVAAGAMAAVQCGFPVASMRVPNAEDEPAAITPLWHVKAEPREGVRRFPERRHDGRHRARQPGRLLVGRAPEALHHARHGDRSGQGRERDRPCDPRRSVGPRDPAGRRHDLSPALRAGEHRRAVGPSSPQGFSPDPAHAVARVGDRAGRRVHRKRRMAARAVLPARRREGLA